MADAKKCDICGNLYEIPANGRAIGRIVFHNELNYVVWDICPNCKNKIEHIIAPHVRLNREIMEKEYCCICMHKNDPLFCDACCSELNTMVGCGKPYLYRQLETTDSH